MQFLVKSQTFFIDIDKLILKFIWHEKCLKTAKTSLKRNKVGIMTLPDVEAYL